MLKSRYWTSLLVWSLVILTAISLVPIAQAQTPAPADTSVGEKLIQALPAELQPLYTGQAANVLPSAYDNWTPPAKPWKLCYADSYEGNPWRVQVRDEIVRLAEQFKSANIVSSFEYSVSNNDVAQDISNIRTFIDKKCSIIMAIPESSTGLNDAVKAAYDAGIPFVTVDGPVTSPYAINVNSNYWLWGNQMIEGIAKTFDGKANVLIVEGLAGHPIVLEEWAGAEAALKNYPDLKIVAKVNGNWTLSDTKAAVMQALATHPEQIDAVWTTGSEARAIAEAFAEAGRPVPLVTGSLTGDIMGYWHEKGDAGFKFYGHGVLPHKTAQAVFRVAIRMLEGQKPNLNLIMIPMPEVTQATLPNWYKPCMTSSTTSIFPIPPEDPMPEETMNAYFTNGAATPPYDYATVPDPCAGAATK